jgi:cytochrome P450
MDGLYRVFGVMFKVYSQGLFLDSVSPAPLFSSWNHLIQAGCQIIQAERGFYYQLLLAKKFDVIKLGRLVNQVATANTMAWMMHFLTDNPAVQRTMQQEADTVLGEARMLPDVQAQDRLRYIDAVALETLRLKGVAPVLSMEPLQAVEIGGLHLPASTAVFLLTRYGGLHEPAFTHAGQFQPERWLTASLEPRTGHTPQAFMPFGGGPRVCPGRHLAWLEITTVMAMLGRNFTLTKPVDAPPVGEHFAFTMKPTHLRLLLRPRA